MAEPASALQQNGNGRHVSSLTSWADAAEDESPRDNDSMPEDRSNSKAENAAPSCAPPVFVTSGYIMLVVPIVPVFPVPTETGKSTTAAAAWEQAPSPIGIQHRTGHCKPCAFFHKDVGCQSGAACPFCHECPPDERRRRKWLRRKARQQRQQAPISLCQLVCSNEPYTSELAGAEEDAKSDVNFTDTDDACSPRCKPCAFFHTKGCRDGECCAFCHLCPAKEKWERKETARRLARERRELLLNPAKEVSAGHSREASGASHEITATCSTWSGGESATSIAPLRPPR